MVAAAVAIAVVVLMAVVVAVLLLDSAQDSVLMTTVGPKLAIGKRTQEEDGSTTVLLVLSVNVLVPKNRIPGDVDVDDNGGGGNLEIWSITEAKCVSVPNVDLLGSHNETDVAAAVDDDSADDVAVVAEVGGSDQEIGPRIVIRVVVLGHRVMVQYSASMAGTRNVLRCVWM